MKGKLFSEGRVLAILIALLAIIHSCGKDKEQPEEDPAPNHPSATKPEIMSFSPARGMPGTQVIITGKNFKENELQNDVRFQGTFQSAHISKATATELTVEVPDNAVTGKIIVKVGNESDTSATDFTVDPEVTTITGFQPKEGPIGTPVTITGRKFSDAITVKINGITATVQSRSATRIVCIIPTNTTLTVHKLIITSGSDVLETAEPFTVTGGPYAHWEYKDVDLLPIEGYWLGLSFVQNNKLFWGFTGLSATDDVSDYFEYVPAAHSQGWQARFPPPVDPAHGKWIQATAVVHNNRIFMGTGLYALQGPAAHLSNKWYEFHAAPVTQQSTFTRLTDFPHAVSGAVSFVLNDKIYAGFGSTNKNLYRFDPAANNNQGSWTLAATAPFSELNAGSAVVLGNEVYLGRILPAMLQPRNGFYRYTEAGGFTKMTDIPEDDGALITPSFSMGNKAYFIIHKRVWEYTPGANGGSWRAVIAHNNAPDITHVAALQVNGSRVIYGWTNTGRLHEFKFN